MFRLLALVLFVVAALAGFGVGIHWDVGTTLGVIASGLAALAASGLTIPAPPPRL